MTVIENKLLRCKRTQTVPQHNVWLSTVFVLCDDPKRNHVFDELIETARAEFAKTSGRLCRQAVSAMVVAVDCKIILQQNLGELCITTHVLAEPVSDLDDSTNVLRANPLHAGDGKPSVLSNWNRWR